MTAFPLRPTRQIFGPIMRDEAAVSDPKRKVGADVFNLMFWQAAGISQTSPLVTTHVAMDSGLTAAAMAAWDDEIFGYSPYPPPTTYPLLSDWPWVQSTSWDGQQFSIQFADQVPSKDQGLLDLNFQYGNAAPLFGGVPTTPLVLLEPSVVIETGSGGLQNLVKVAVRINGTTFGPAPVTLSLW